MKQSGAEICYNRKGVTSNACEPVVPTVNHMLSTYLLYRSCGAADTKFELTRSCGTI